MLEINEVYQADCLYAMRYINDASIDMILCDLPYGTTSAKWDTVIPFDKLWEHYHRIIKPVGVICLFASQPFTTYLIASNIDNFKYCWYWIKSKPNGWQHSKNRPMTKVEEVCVFSKASMGHVSRLGNKRMYYDPQGVIVSDKVSVVKDYWHGRSMGARPNQTGREYVSMSNFPDNVLHFANINGKTAKHSAEKPVPLLEYLIKTYTTEGMLVLDNCAGSGSIGVACVNLNRNYILIELLHEYCELSCKRLQLSSYVELLQP